MPVKPDDSGKRRRLPLLLPDRLRPKSKAGKAGMIAGGVVAGLVAIDLIALAAVALFAVTAGAR